MVSLRQIKSSSPDLQHSISHRSGSSMGLSPRCAGKPPRHTGGSSWEEESHRYRRWRKKSAVTYLTDNFGKTVLQLYINKKCLSPPWHPCLHDYGLGLIPSETSYTNYWPRLLTTLFFRGQNYLSATPILFQLKREIKHYSCSLKAGFTSQTVLFLDVIPAHINQMQLKERKNSHSI